MPASKPVRMSTERADLVDALAKDEHRTFVAQLDLVVDAGLAALEGQNRPPQRNRDRESRARTTT